MGNIGKPERETQNRLLALFRDESAIVISAIGPIAPTATSKNLTLAAISPKQQVIPPNKSVAPFTCSKQKLTIRTAVSMTTTKRCMKSFVTVSH